ncbi:extracellular solute-binding protein family 1 [Thermotoga petrophila RKU-10]|jgi:spermidine/putrescine transport system substrate-binding protein|uniref:Extracellular solute-binding protein, family 1 n=2 Tax=Thermotoga petrophila TaxID=93929 RepID=A5IMJ8_THEP1|nr:extracellular solute-binding protein [Thermotoga petrophila]ABQ47421.1 extracellular solute-binding protein, family 1 [Thermotoga petrophila RKU-1]ADA67510.1 extracellular solute-binding protein family 1 [Thermotoga petrophila RKU-10]HAA82049.1 spermidine/putrescine ABC transporter substrate-binding protein [Thermotoga petrophila]
MMKKVLLALLVVLSISIFAKATLYIYNWADYIPEDVIRAFEEKYDCRVVYDNYASNEEMYAKFKAGGGKGYDLIFPSGDYVSIMKKEGMLQKLDLSRIPNFKYLDKDILTKTTYDPNHEYSIPYMMGSTVVIVNKKYVKEYEKSWSIFDREDLRGRMTLLDDMREVLGAALKYLGYSVNTKNPKELEEAKQVVLRWKKNIAKFDASSYADGVVSGEYWVVHGYAEDVYQRIPEGEEEYFDFFIPKEGGTLWIDNMVIPKGAKNVDLAYKFINFILEPENAAKIADYLGLPSPNVEARKYMQTEPIYTIEDLKNCEFIEDVGEALELYNKIWLEIIM